MEYLPRHAQRTQPSASPLGLHEERNTTHEGPRASRHFLPTCAIFSSRLYLRTGSQILSIGSADLLVLALGMMVNSPLVVRLPPSVIWPLVPLMANRALEMLCLLLGFVTPLFSVLQLPLSLTALGLYIRDTQCGPFSRHSPASPPQPFCTAPIVLAAVIVLVEVVVFLMVLFISQTFRHERIMELAQQVADADLERARRAFRVDIGDGRMVPAKRYIVVKQPCGQEYMVAKALQGPPALPSSADAPTGFPLGMLCNSVESPASSEQQAMLACPVLTEAGEDAALQRSGSQSLGVEDAASVERGGPVRCVVGQTSVQLGGNDRNPADATQILGLVVSSSEQEVSRHLGEGSSCSTAQPPVTEQQASRPQAAAAQEPVPSKAGTAGTSSRAFAQLLPEDDSACRQAIQGAAEGAGQRHRRQSRDSLSTAQACNAFMADVSTLQVGRVCPSTRRTM